LMSEFVGQSLFDSSHRRQLARPSRAPGTVQSIDT